MCDAGRPIPETSLPNPPVSSEHVLWMRLPLQPTLLDKKIPPLNPELLHLLVDRRYIWIWKQASIPLTKVVAVFSL
jgi:hypothetical protein